MGILEKAPAALKLAEATGSIALVEADGGKKGVDEVTNFRALLKEVKRLPQYAAVLEEFEAWKSGKRTEQQVLLWVQQKIANSELDADWITLASAPFVESDPRKMAQEHQEEQGKCNGGSSICGYDSRRRCHRDCDHWVGANRQTFTSRWECSGHYLINALHGI